MNENEFPYEGTWPPPRPPSLLSSSCPPPSVSLVTAPVRKNRNGRAYAMWAIVATRILQFLESNEKNKKPALRLQSGLARSSPALRLTFVNYSAGGRGEGASARQIPSFLPSRPFVPAVVNRKFNLSTVFGKDEYFGNDES